LGRNERAAQVGGDITLGAGGGDGVAEYLAACAAQPLGRLVAAFVFHLAEHYQQFLRGNGGDGAFADGPVDEVQQPAQFLHGDGGAALALDLRQPFVGHRLEAVGRRDSRRDPFQLDLLGGIVAARQNLAGRVALLAGFGKASVGINAERQRLLLAKMAIVHPPVAAAIGSDIEE